MFIIFDTPEAGIGIPISLAGLRRRAVKSQIGKKGSTVGCTVDQASVGGRTCASPVQGCADEAATRPRSKYSRFPVSTRVPGTFAELKNGDAVMLVVNSGITLEGSDLHSRHSAKLGSGGEHTAPGIEAFAQLAAAGLTLRLRLGVSACANRSLRAGEAGPSRGSPPGGLPSPNRVPRPAAELWRDRRPEIRGQHGDRNAGPRGLRRVPVASRTALGS